MEVVLSFSLAWRRALLFLSATFGLLGCTPAPHQSSPVQGGAGPVASPPTQRALPARAPSPTQNLDAILRAASSDAPAARPARAPWRTHCNIDRARATVYCAALQTARSGESLVVAFSRGVLLVDVGGRNTASPILTLPVVRVDNGNPRSMDDRISNNWLRDSSSTVREMLRGERAFSSRTNYPYNNTLTGEYKMAGFREALVWIQQEYNRLYPQVAIRHN